MLAMYIIGFMGGHEWILLVLALLFLFGGRKIPELMKGLGKGISEFKNAKKEMDDAAKDDEPKDKV